MPKWHYTTKKGEIACSRKETYKSMCDYERAFYKFICKQGWYSNMKDGVRPPQENLNGAGGYWMHGYPKFRAWQSEAYRQFNNAANAGIKNGFHALRIRKYEEWKRDRKERDDRIERENRLNRAEMQTGWAWWHAASELGIPVVFESELPVDLIEAKQFQMGLRTLINAAKKNRKTHTDK